jgi:hypothetical protein
LLAIAARVGEVRLIDNAVLTAAASTPRHPLTGEEIATCNA